MNRANTAAALTASLLTVCTSVLTAAEPRDLDSIAVTADLVSYASQSFDMGVVRNHWSKGQRVELNGWADFESGRIQPAGGAYLFFEDRSWDGSNHESGDYTAWGIGLQGGASCHLTAPEGALRLTLAPYLRGGLGGQSLTVNNVAIDDDSNPATPSNRYSLSSGSGRVEVAAGADLRLRVAHRIEVVFGGGVDSWSAANVYISSGSSGGSVGVVGNSYTFSGQDAFVRFGAGMTF
jgi:hypothetical protein